MNLKRGVEGMIEMHNVYPCPNVDHTYPMSWKSRPSLYSKLLDKMGPDILDIKYTVESVTLLIDCNHYFCYQLLSLLNSARFSGPFRIRLLESDFSELSDPDPKREREYLKGCQFIRLFEQFLLENLDREKFPSG